MSKPLFQIIRIDTDAKGTSQTTDQRIARVISLFQAGWIAEEVARESIRRMGSGEDVVEIETVKRVVQPLDVVSVVVEAKREVENRNGKFLAPREPPKFDPKEVS